MDTTESSLVIKEDDDFLSQDLNILRNVYGDPGRFVQIMQNFLSNALKFTEKGGDVTVKVSILEIQDIIREE